MTSDNSSNVSSAAAGAAPTSATPGGGSETARMARKRRRSRFRTTAFPVARPIENATRVGVTSGSGTNEHHNGSIRRRVPSRRRRSKVARSWIRPIKPTGGPGPWLDGSGSRRGRHACSCGRGTRACGIGGGCWAGTYASRRSPDVRDDKHVTWQARHGGSVGNTRGHGLTDQGYGLAADTPNLGDRRAPAVNGRRHPYDRGEGVSMASRYARSNDRGVSYPQGGSNRETPAYGPDLAEFAPLVERDMFGNSS